MHSAFNNELYIKLQSEKILERIKQYDDKLYLEFGGKIFDDYHASRVLPGFGVHSKVEMLKAIKDKVEIVIAISAEDIENHRMRNDLGIAYENEVLRLIDSFNSIDLLVSSVVITKYKNQVGAMKYKTKLENLGIKVFLHYPIPNYPTDTAFIVSEKGYGKNQYIKTSRPIVVVTAPGSGSGKMAVCLSQLYHENNRGVHAGYAKFETFPIWNLPLKHPVNLAYEAATADLSDVNMIDPYHLSEYGIPAVNYNRDVEVFPVLLDLFNKIYGTSPYKSPTDMGVNMAGFCIEDETMVRKACKMEAIRRYLDALCFLMNGQITNEVINKLSLIMSQLETSIEERKTYSAAHIKEQKVKVPVVALEMNDGMIITGKASKLMNATAACLINAIKYLANISDDLCLISPEVLEPIQHLKSDIYKKASETLNASDVLIAIAIEATRQEAVKKAFDELTNLNGAEVHSTVILEQDDQITLKNLYINYTFDPVVFAKKYHQKGGNR